MVAGMHTAWRCKKCGEIFFTSKNTYGVLPSIQKLLNLLICPKCGSKDVVEEKGVKS